MKEKYRELADQLRNIADNNIYGHTAEARDSSIKAVTKAADFLQSLADMSSEEPDAKMFCDPPKTLSYKDGIKYVTKAKCDWWRNKALLNNSIKDQCIKALEQQLSAANARIAELTIHKDIVAVDHEGMPVYALEDQPKRPLLADQPEVFEALAEFVKCAVAYGAIPLTSTGADVINAELKLHKLLVGS